jgi:tight adherence protein C
VSAGATIAAAAAGGASACIAAGCHAVRRSRPFPPIASGRVVRAPRTRRSDRMHRLRDVHEEIPQFLDLLAAGSTAGLSAEVSFRQAASCLHGPLGRDLEDVLRSVDLGVPWREAIEGYVERADDVDLRRMASVLARTETLGVSLRDATRDLAETVRDARRSSTLERARTAPVRMLFPLVFLILPAFLLLTVVPVLITTVRAIH